MKTATTMHFRLLASKPEEVKGREDFVDIDMILV
jgi:hypothetical protein